MSDPKRWLLEGAGSTRDERDILRAAAGADIDPPPGSQGQVWAALLAQIGPGGGGGGGGPEVAQGAGNAGQAASAAGQAAAAAGAAGAAGAGSAGSGSAAAAGGAAAGSAAPAAGSGALGGVAVSGGILKSMLIGAASAGALIAGYALVVPDKPSSPTPPPAAVAQAPSTGAPAAPLGRAAGEASPAAKEALQGADPPKVPASPERHPADLRAERAAGQKPDPQENEADPHAAITVPPSEESAASTGAAITPAERASRLREESRLLSEARDALRQGDSAGALRKLEEARTRFAGGMLGQEREALTIEALYKGGQREAAAARAASFLRAYPLSPHATRVQAFAR